MSRKPRITAGEIERVQQLLAEGRTVLQIAEVLGRPRQTIWRIAIGRYQPPAPNHCRSRTGHRAASEAAAATRSSARSLRPAGAKAAPFSDEWFAENDARFRAAVSDRPLNATANHVALSSDVGGT